MRNGSEVPGDASGAHPERGTEPFLPSWLVGGWWGAPGPQQGCPCQWHGLAGTTWLWKRWAASLQPGTMCHLAVVAMPPHVPSLASLKEMDLVYIR